MSAVESGTSSDVDRVPEGGRGRIPWGRLALEMGVIVFSVLLALVLDDWRQARDQRELVEATSTSLLIELERNQRSLEASLPYHEAMRDRLEGFATAGQDAPAPSLAELGFDPEIGVGLTPSRTAWETALNADALRHLSHELAFVLASVYTAQDELGRSVDRLRDHVDRYRLAVYEGAGVRGAAAGLKAGLAGVLQGEKALCAGYRTLALKLAGRVPPDGKRCGSGNVEIR